MTTDNFCFYLQNRLIQTSQTGGQQYSDTSLFSIPCLNSDQNITDLTLLIKVTLAKLNQSSLAFVSICKHLFYFFVNTPLNIILKIVIIVNLKTKNCQQ